MTSTNPGRAIRSGSAAGIVIALLMLVLAGTASAQGARTAAKPVHAPGTWDSLYHAGRIFELRDSVIAGRRTANADIRLFRGLVAHAFNDNDTAIALLAPFVADASHSPPTQRLLDAVDALGESYARVFRYREAAETYRAALRLRPAPGDSATRGRFEAWAAIDDALASTPPQRTGWSAEANGIASDNAGIPFAIAATIGEDTLRIPMSIDPRAAISTIDSSTAAAQNVVVLGGPVRVTLGLASVSARVGVIGSLDLGLASFANVAVLIVPDATLRSLAGTSGTRGSIGFPVLSALGSVSFDRDGRIALSSPGADVDTSSVSNVFIGRNDVIVRALYDGASVTLALEPSRQTSVLLPDFLQRFPNAPRDRPITYTEDGVSARQLAGPGYAMRSMTLMIGGRSLQLTGVPALLDSNRPVLRGLDGVLGQDAFRSVRRVTIDFGSMTARIPDRVNAPVLPQLVYPASGRAAAPGTSRVPEDLAFVALLFALFVVPKALQRYRLPSAVTSLLMGIGATSLGFFHNDPTLHLLSTFGIVALFLFAGLDIDGHQLRKSARPLVMHGIAWSVVLAIGSLIAIHVFGFSSRPAVLIALALLTPSTGFILSSLPGFGLLESERFTVKTYAIASELLALTVLFFVLQSTSPARLAIAVGAMLAVIVVIPLAFRLFARLVAPHAPRSEFAFLLMVAIVCAYATRRLGVYYLVGAFLVGIAAQRFRSELPAMSSEKMVDALESFGSVFIPFYFFHAGTDIVAEQLSLRAMAVGLGLVALLIPLRIGITILQRRLGAGERSSVARRVGFALVPTLVFTLVLTDILNTEFGVSQYVLGALVLYTVVNTTVPAFVLKSSAPEFENVEAAELEQTV